MSALKIGLLADTHSHLDAALLQQFSHCDEIWHAGDFGTLTIAETLAQLAPLRGVYGNIDPPELRHRYPEDLHFDVAGLSVFMTHIGGYPGRYTGRVKKILATKRPKLFICGHSHILKVVPDAELGLLHLNPGAAGHEGFHLQRTLLRFTLEDGKIANMEVVELGKRGQRSL